VANQEHQWRRVEHAEKHCEQSDDLRQGVGLAEETGAEILHADAGI